MRRALFIAALFALPASGGVATTHSVCFAQTKDPAALYARGRSAVERGDYQAALADLEPSFEALPSPNTQLLIAHAKRGLGRTTEAIRDYERCIAAADAKVTAGESRYQQTSQEARKWLDTLAAELANVSVRVTHAPDLAVVRINGEAAQSTREQGWLSVTGYWIYPGKVTVRVEAAGRSKEATVDLSRGAKQTVTLDFEPVQEAPPAPTSAAPPSPTTPPSSGGPPVSVWIAGGVGIAGLAMFGVFGSMAKGKYDDLQTCSPNCPESERSVADSGKSYQTIANVGLVVGVLGLATAGGILVFAPKKQPPSQSVGLAVGPGNVSVLGKF